MEIEEMEKELFILGIKKQNIYFNSECDCLVTENKHETKLLIIMKFINRYVLIIDQNAIMIMSREEDKQND